MIQAVHLRKVFSTSGNNTVEAVADASFAVDSGEIFGLLGPNGAGKTTLLRMLATIIQPTSGYCIVGDARSDLAPEQIRRSTGFLSGNTKLYGRLKARELLEYFGALHSMNKDILHETVKNLASRLDMEEILERRCDSLSTGQLQKVNIGRVLLHDPPVLILDEPTLGLDILTSETILEFIQDAKRRGRSIIFSTHYMTEAELLCDRVGLIHRGNILAIGSKSELYNKTGADNLKDAFLRTVRAASIQEAHQTSL